VPQDEFLADVAHLNRMGLLLGLLGIVFVGAVVVLIANSITRPLRLLSGATRDIARGRLDAPLPEIRSRDEVGGLAASFARMREDLRTYIRELTEATAAKERMESELAIAHDIQMKLLPQGVPDIAESGGCEAFALLEPAREVGGDLYDMFFVDRKRLCIVVGDVSGKGVPAALFMAMTKTFLKAVAQETGQPAAILDRVNRELSRDNDSCMFVTVFCGLLDVSTGELRYANAGHNAPLLVSGGAASFLEGGRGPVVGIVEDARYVEGVRPMSPGDVLILYTDGVTEAFDGRGEQFAEERLVREAAAPAEERVEGLVRRIAGAVELFANGTPQSDDIAIVAVRYRGPAARKGKP
jgi:phosphoserine phosphatase RsbU/P